MMYPTPRYAGLTSGAVKIEAPPVSVVATLGLVLVRRFSRLPSVSDVHQEVLLAREDVDRSQQIHQAAEAHVAEQDLRRLRALLPCLVNFRRRHRFRDTEARDPRPSRAAAA